MRICFLFNHDQVHQVAHSLPIALAMLDANVDAEIVIATSNPRLTAEVTRLSGGRPGLPIAELGLTRRSSQLANRMLERLLPAGKLLFYRDNLEFFRKVDVLVVAEKTSLILKTKFGLDHLKIVHTRHGAGDRAVGFDPASALFDHVLVSGPKIRERLVSDTGVRPEAISVVGYPKFDMASATPVRPLPNDGRPLVLYNPHVSPHLSSWFTAGRQVLDWFVDHPEYQLIFAPHVMLFERPFTISVDKLRIDRPGRMEARHLNAPNIHIDLGSRASTTMAYTQAADIYLGDASSQVYEFLLRSRPCIFLNPQDHDWRDDKNFGHWNLGKVINGVDQLGDALETAATDHAAGYRHVQREQFENSFDLTEEPSARRAARAVATFAGLTAPLLQPLAEFARVAYG
jgi:CDP-glycerol glycerophosphotransferase (TagB/SpsB family)